MQRYALGSGLLGGLLAAQLLLPTGAVAADGQPLKLVGAGASFPAPLYLRWVRSYSQTHPETRIDYQPVSSAGGVKDLIAGLVDFAGSDLQMTAAEQAQVAGGAMELPMAVGAIVLVYNLDGVPALRLSRAATIGIFEGTVTRWNDPAIAATNPDLTLPDLPITVVTRVGASGTSYTLTQHLGTISPSFADAVVTSLSPTWPERLQARGGLVKAGGNDGVAATVRAIPGSIGYVQYAYAMLTDMAMAAIENQSGNIVAPNEASFAAAMDVIRTERTLEALRDPPGDRSYPMIGVSWLIFRQQYDNPAKLAAMIGLIDYALGAGQADVARLGYIPFSAGAIAYIRGELARLQPDQSSPEQASRAEAAPAQ